VDGVVKCLEVRGKVNRVVVVVAVIICCCFGTTVLSLSEGVAMVIVYVAAVSNLMSCFLLVVPLGLAHSFGIYLLFHNITGILNLWWRS
jgi:large-conductance mechanosensitive channel